MKIYKDPDAPHTVRLKALMAALGYGKHGDQKDFAAAIGIEPNRLSNILSGHPLTLEVTKAIYRTLLPASEP